MLEQDTVYYVSPTQLQWYISLDSMQYTTMDVIEFYHSSSYHEGRGGNYMKIMQLRRMLRTSGENEKGF